MPIYEFKCRQCNHVFESLCTRSSDANQAVCPACGAEQAERLLSTFCSVSASPAQGLGSSPAASSCGSTGGFS